MASCTKCGGKVNKTSSGQKSCRRCGVQSGPFGLDRSGTTVSRPHQTYTPAGPAYIVGSAHTPRLKGTPT